MSDAIGGSNGYLQHWRAGRPGHQDFGNALTMLTTKAKEPPLADVPFAEGDEHGRLDLSKTQREVKLGDRIEFIAPHCDPSVNVYDAIHLPARRSR